MSNPSNLRQWQASMSEIIAGNQCLWLQGSLLLLLLSDIFKRTEDHLWVTQEQSTVGTILISSLRSKCIHHTRWLQLSCKQFQAWTTVYIGFGGHLWGPWRKMVFFSFPSLPSPPLPFPSPGKTEQVSPFPWLHTPSSSLASCPPSFLASADSFSGKGTGEEVAVSSHIPDCVAVNLSGVILQSV